MTSLFAHPALLCALLLASPLAAVESELRLGPDEVLVDSEFLSQYIELGAVRVEDLTWRLRGRGRINNIGLELETFTAVDEDDRIGYSRGEVVEVRARADYVLEIEGYGQLIPYIAASFYPADELEDLEEPVWVGVEGWYMLPVEGIEVGGSLNVDGAGEHGFFVDVGFRELLQMAPLDLQAWQTINFGDDDFHQFTSGHDDSGFGVLNLGALATLPLPWEDTFATMRAELYGWLEGDDRNAVDEDLQFLVAVGFEWRPW